ncbi:MAG: hypothetical protein MK089_09190 [Phycisphaerales bacterium]|nr:hypothetical protein [Phycisphaerales bacterium]
MPRNWPRRRLIVLLVICGLVAGGWLALWLLTQPGVVASFVMGRLAQMSGGEATYDSASWIDSNQLEIRGFKLVAPALSGPESEIASVDSLVLNMAISGIFSGEVVYGVKIDGATLRVAENQNAPWDYNLNTLTPPEEGGGKAEFLPTILVSGLRLETGTYDPDRSDSWVLSGRANFAGQAVVDPTTEDYRFQLDELTADEGRAPLKLQGQLDPDGERVEAAVTGVMLDEELKDLMPASVVRRVWSEFDLKGAVDSITAVFQAGQPPEIALALDDVKLVIPRRVFTPEFIEWSNYSYGQIMPGEHDENPLLHVNSGRIIFSGSSLQLERLDGVIIGDSGTESMTPVPYVIDFMLSDLPSMAALPDGASLDEVLARTGMDLRIKTRGFQLDHGASAGLPREVAEIFELFGVQSCFVEIEMNFSRAAGDSTDDPISYEGALVIRDAAGAFRGFPYPLEDLDAHIVFDDKLIQLKDLHARGSGDSLIAMAGVVSSEAQPSVQINLAATDLPLDSSLIDAMPDGARSMMLSLFGKHGARSKVVSGGDSTGHEHVGLDLDISRPSGRDQETTLSGQITFDELELTWDGFPYPITLGKGRLDWHDGILDIENVSGNGPVAMSTAGEGEGVVIGEIVLPTEDQAATGNLEIVVKGDTISPELIQALDRIAQEEARLLRGLGIGGVVDYAGEFTVIPGGEPEYDLVLKLVDGFADPQDDVAGMLGLPGPIWPADFRLDQLQASLVVSTEMVIIESMHGHNDLTNLDLEGRIGSGAAGSIDLSVVVDALPVSDRIAVVFPESEQEILTGLWNRWAGSGQVSLLLDVPERDLVDGVVSAVRIETGDGHVCRLKEGSISFDQKELVIDDVSLEFERPQLVPPWELAMDGVIGRGEVAAGRMKISSPRARFGSPFLSAVVSALMPSGPRETWDGMQLDGWFAGEFDLKEDPESFWELWLEPREVSAVHEGQRLEARFDSGRVSMLGSGEAMGQIVGESNFGRFDIEGQARIGEASEIDLDFEFEGRLGDPAARAILPESLGGPLGELDWQDGEGTRIQQGQLFIRLGDDDEPLEILAEGDVLLQGAGMDLGMEIQSIDASLRGRYHAPEGQVATLDVRMDAPSLVAGGRTVEGFNGGMSLSESGDVLKINADRGRVGTGAVSVGASLAIDADDPNRSSDADDWEVELLIANADLVKLFAVEQDPDQEELEESSGSVKDEIEGRVHMSLFMAGQFSEPVSRRGVGRIRITDAVIGDVPIIMGIQQMLHLTVPTLSRPDFVEIEYYVTGSEIVLDQILIESSLGEFSVFSMTGSGTFDYGSGEIDAVLYPRGGLLIVDDIIGFVQDQVYGIGVSGPISDPEIGLVPFPKLR